MRLAGARGQALTEFVVVVPLFLFLLLGVVQLGLLFFAYQTVHYASFSACRAAIVRPCMAFRPENDTASNFTPAVFSAAALANMAAMPGPSLFGGPPHAWMPDLPNTDQVRDLDLVDNNLTGAEDKYGSAAVLTSVRRVVPRDLEETPPVWEPTDLGPGPGAVCMDALGLEVNPQQNVPPTGYDVSLEVALLYPMIIPFANRVFYGVFINFSPLALEIGVPPIPGDQEDVMVQPIEALPFPSLLKTRMFSVVQRIAEYCNYSNPTAVAVAVADAFGSRSWYPMLIRARTTLTVEAAPFRMTYP